MSATRRMRGLAVLPLTLLLTVVSLGTVLIGGATSASAVTRQQRIGNGFDIVRHQQGDWYGYGAAGPNRFDCSGLVYYSYRKAGFRNVPRTSSGQAGHMRRVNRSNMRKGDLVFFYNGSARASNVYHVGVYSGWHNGRRTIIHSPRSGERVHRAPIWTSRWFAGTLRGA